jgi:multidrug resistance protein
MSFLAAHVGRLSNDGGNVHQHVGDVDVEKAGSTQSDGTIMSEKDADSSVVDWDGPNDPDKPLNWSPLKKWVNILAISSLTLLTQVHPFLEVQTVRNPILTCMSSPFGSSMFAPAIPQVMQEFGSSDATLGILAVSIYVLGYAFGPLILAPISEMYGRLVLYHSTTIFFMLMNVACARSTNMPMLVVFRFLAGLIGSCPLTLGPGSIADCFKQEERGFVIAIWTLPILLGPAVGPVAGGYITEYLGWRADFWFLVIAVCIPPFDLS